MLEAIFLIKEDLLKLYYTFIVNLFGRFVRWKDRLPTAFLCLLQAFYLLGKEGQYSPCPLNLFIGIVREDACIIMR